MAYNPLHKLTKNLAAIRIALKGTTPGAEEMEVLKRYSGFGGIKAVLYPEGSKEAWIASGATGEDLKLYQGIQDLHQLLRESLHDDGYNEVIASVKNSVLTAFYTPPVVPAILYEALKAQGAQPKNLYEPSSGAGVFITEGVNAFPGLQRITAVEKDVLTGSVLQALCKGLPVEARALIQPFEETSTTDNGSYDLIASNIPFGAFSVYDPDYPDGALSGKIHNYFFAKGLDKIREGGLLAYITTGAFLNSPSNQTARDYLFSKANFVSLAVLPDNLMKETGNTEAPNHLLVLQKAGGKKNLSEAEKHLLQTVLLKNEFGTYSLNAFIHLHPQIICANESVAGKNQYGHAHQRVWQKGDMEDIGDPLRTLLARDLSARFNLRLFQQNRIPLLDSETEKGNTLTFLAPPEANQGGAEGAQLGLFDALGATAVNRVFSYLSKEDDTAVQRHTARVAAVTRTEEPNGHESLVLLTAKAKASSFYVYKLCSNLKEIDVPHHWMNGHSLQHSLHAISEKLKNYPYIFRFDGEAFFEASFGLNRKKYVKGFPSFYKEGTLVVHGDKTGTLRELSGEKGAMFQPLPTGGTGAAFYQTYVRLRDSYFVLARAESEMGKEQTALREILNAAYGEFFGQYGVLNQPSNRAAILNDALGFITLSSLERKEGDRYIKSDVLSGPLFKKEEAFFTDDPVQALTHSLNEKGEVDIEFIAKTIGNTASQTITALGDHIYLNPASRQWETADQYLSGNVVVKLAKAMEAAALNPSDNQVKRSLAAISEVHPEKIPFEVLDFNMGERWLPVAYYQQFTTKLFCTETSVTYLPSVDAFKVVPDRDNAKITEEYAVTAKSGKTTSGATLMEHALENTSPFYTYEVEGPDGKTVRVPDSDATQLAHQKIEGIRTQFVNWLQALPKTHKETIENVYNDTFNCYVLRAYNGSHLTFPGLDRAALGITDLYDSQKSAAWRILQNRGALIDHEVGLGKTLTIIVASHEMKRLGIIHKPLILALKANVTQIAETYRKAYPAARILAPGENDFTPQKRQALFHAIKNNNWDCILLTHDQFQKIPQSPFIQKQILQAELTSVEQDLETVKGLGGSISKKMLKGLEVRKNNLGNQVKEIVQKIEQKKDTDINFKELGIDHLFVDEAHKFKNLTFTTRHNRVAGLGTTEGSQKALNMLFAVRTLQRKFNSDLCVTFLSGTPVSNSLTEMYLLFKYLRPREMERQRIENFDGWAAVFAKKTTDFEFSVTNEIIAKERFRHFIKVPELALFYNEITDYKTAKHIALDKPALKEVLVNLKPTEDQQAFIRALMAFAQTGNGALIGRAPLSPEEDKGRMLIATNYAKKMAVDLRLINPVKYDDHPGNKVSACAEKVARIYKESTAHRGTQIIFSDIGTPKPDAFNVYGALKDKLVSAYNIPAHHISFIHDWTDKKKPELFRRMNEGSIRVLIGSTDKAGTGLNVQHRVVAVHHLDIPWKPSELEQRNGRGARQGNIIAKAHYGNEVVSYIYAVEQSLDNYKFNLLKNKQTFISQMKNSSLSVRSIDEGAMDEKSGMNFSEYIAILSGDTTLLQKAKVDKKIAVLESLRAVHGKEAARTKVRLERLYADTAQIKQILSGLTRDEKLYTTQLGFDKEGSKLNPVQLVGLSSSDPQAIGRQIIDLYLNWKPEGAQGIDEKIGMLYGFNLFIRQQQESREEGGLFSYSHHNVFYVQHTDGGIKYTYNQGHPTADNPKLAARHFICALDRVEKLKQQYEREVEKLTADIPVLQGLIAKPFEKESELKNLKEERTKLERAMAMKVEERKLNGVQEPPAVYHRLPSKERDKIKEPLHPKKAEEHLKKKCAKVRF